jgi:hypothetical protein
LSATIPLVAEQVPHRQHDAALDAGGVEHPEQSRAIELGLIDDLRERWADQVLMSGDARRGHALSLLGHTGGRAGGEDQRRSGQATECHHQGLSRTMSCATSGQGASSVATMR